MTRWFVQDGNDVEELNEDRLRKRLSNGDLSGMELAHTDSDLAWRPLHDWPVFTEVVPFRGSPQQAARARVRHGFFWHLAAFVAVIGFLTIRAGSVPSWSLFWLLGLASHGFKALPALKQEPVSLPRAESEPVPLAEPAALPIAEVRAPGFLGEVEATLAELARIGGERVDVGALREGAEALHKALARLAEAGNPEGGALLQEALDAAEGRAQETADDASAEIFQAEANAIAARLEAWQDAATAVSRLKARQRTLLHQLHALRLELARGGAPAPSQADPVQDQVRQPRQEAIAAAEIDQDLARARRARKAT